MFGFVVWGLVFHASVALGFDPFKIIVEDPFAILEAELPLGNVDLAQYRATVQDIELYADFHSIEHATTKDYAKAPNCNRAEVDALKRWASNVYYEEINHALRTAQEGVVDGEQLSSRLQNLILVLSSAVNCAPQFTGQVVRGENAPEFILKQYEKGNDLGFRGFTSTSKGMELSKEFEEKSKQRIFISNASGADIVATGIPAWESEKEVLIRPGTVFRVLSREKDSQSDKINLQFEQL